MSNLSKFQQLINERSKSGQWTDLISDGADSLSKSKLVAVSEIPRSAFYQNEDVVEELEKVEIRLRRIGILKNRTDLPKPKRADIEVLELTMELDMLHERLLTVERGREALHSRILEYGAQAQRFNIGGEK